MPLPRLKSMGFFKNPEKKAKVSQILEDLQNLVLH